MTVKRIVPNFYSENLPEARAFYREVLDMDVLMDMGWINTFGSDADASPQISVMRQGGAGTEVPDVSVEVEDVDVIYARCNVFGSEIVLDICNEDWGVRRFFVKDPCGKLLNILSHNS